PPDTAPQRNAFRGWRAGCSNLAWRRGAAAAVQPAVRTPMQAIGQIVIINIRHIESVENDLRRTVGLVVEIAVREEEQSRRAHGPDSPVSNLDAGEPLHVVRKHLPRVEL